MLTSFRACAVVVALCLTPFASHADVTCSYGTRVLVANGKCETAESGDGLYYENSSNWLTAEHTVFSNQLSSVVYCPVGYDSITNSAVRQGHRLVAKYWPSLCQTENMSGGTKVYDWLNMKMPVRYIALTAEGSSGYPPFLVTSIEAFDYSHFVPSILDGLYAELRPISNLSVLNGVPATSMHGDDAIYNAIGATTCTDNYASLGCGTGVAVTDNGADVAWDIGSVKDLWAIRFAVAPAYDGGYQNMFVKNLRLFVSDDNVNWTTVWGPANIQIPTGTYDGNPVSYITVLLNSTEPCPAGTYASAGTVVLMEGRGCTDCPAGKFSSSAGATSCTGSCTNAPTNAEYTSGASSATGCAWRCKTGYNLHNNICDSMTVTLDKNGGTGGTSNLYSTQITVPNSSNAKMYIDSALKTLWSSSNFSVPTRTGYTFCYYSTSASGGQPRIVVNNGTPAITCSDCSQTSLKYFLTKPTTFYAQWTVNKYTCAQGTYLDGITCTTCPIGYKCPGGTYTYNGGIQGRTECSGQNEYQPSTGQSSCASVGEGYFKVSNSSRSDCTSGAYCTGGVRYACSDLPGTSPSPSGGAYSSAVRSSATTACRYTAPSKTITGCASVTSNAVSYNGSAWPASTYSVTANAGYYITNNNTSSASCSQCTGATYCTGGVQHSCPTATTGWTRGTGNGWSAVTSCYQYRTPANCSSGTIQQNAVSDTMWGVPRVTSALTARAGYYASGPLCLVCPATYPNSAAGAKSPNDCYLTTSTGKYVKTAGAVQENCPSGSYCPGGTKVYFSPYTFLESITTSNDAVINTKLPVSVTGYKVKAKMLPNTSSNIFGAYYGIINGIYQRYYVSMVGANRFKNAWFNSYPSYAVSTFVDGAAHEYDVVFTNGRQTVSKDGVQFSSVGATVDASKVATQYMIPAIRNATTYYMQWYDASNDELLRNFIPAHDSTNNVYGMYDTVSNTFFGNGKHDSGVYAVGVEEPSSSPGTITGTTGSVTTNTPITGGNALCPENYRNGAGVVSQGDCIGTFTKSGQMLEPALTAGCASQTTAACTVPTCEYTKKYSGTTVTDCTPGNCTKTITSVVAGNDHYANGTMCPVCPNGWRSPLGATDVGDCGRVLAYQPNGASAPTRIYLRSGAKKTSPSLAAMIDGHVFYGNMTPVETTVSGNMYIRYNNQTYVVGDGAGAM